MWTFKFPMWGGRTKRAAASKQKFYTDTPLAKWGSISDSVEAPFWMFPKDCAQNELSIVGTIFETFPDPGWKNPV